MEAQVNQETCIGCGRCVTTSPEVFVMRKRKSRVRPDADYAMVNYVKMAEKNCPSNSITVVGGDDESPADGGAPSQALS